LNILIVEDEALIALGYEMVLAEAGHNVTGIAWDRSSAFEKVQNEKPDLALVDIHLTDGLTGNEIGLSLCHDHGVSPIFITGNASNVSAEAKDISLAVLLKPITTASLKFVLSVATEKISQRS